MEALRGLATYCSINGKLHTPNLGIGEAEGEERQA
jgi:hypothetical protein